MRGVQRLASASSILVLVLAGCVGSQEVMETDSGGLPASLTFEHQGWEVQVGPSSINATAPEANLLALRFHLEEEVVLPKHHFEFMGHSEGNDDYSIWWVLLWRAGDPLPEAHDFGAYFFQLADVAVLPEATGIGAHKGYWTTMCSLDGGCSGSTGFRGEVQEDLVLDPGTWWFVVGMPGVDLQDFRVDLGFGSDSLRPAGLYMGPECNAVHPHQMDGTFRLNAYWALLAYQDLEVVIPTNDHLFFLRIGDFNVDHEDELELANGTVYRNDRGLLEDGERHLLLYGDDLAGETTYRLQSGVSVENGAFSLNYCTFGEEDVVQLPWGAAG